MSADVPFELDPELLRGKVAVITGASRGLGAGLAERFASYGVELGLCARREPQAPSGVRTLTGAVDVTDPLRLEQFANAVIQRLGPIDLWVNNAGVLDPVGPQRDLDPAEVDRALAVNIGGVVNGTRVFTTLARMFPDRPGVLVNVSSGAATSIYEGWSIYGATKAAVDQFTRITAAEEPGLLCYAVSPGLVDTEMQAKIRATSKKKFPAVARFQTAHDLGAWNSPDWVGDHLLGILAGTLAPERVVYRVPDEPRS
jgi:NAD(P)-dependent dehydrogenase (short-subunit alcohol dehydrogenase family)